MVGYDFENIYSHKYAGEVSDICKDETIHKYLKGIYWFPNNLELKWQQSTLCSFCQKYDLSIRQAQYVNLMYNNKRNIRLNAITVQKLC